MKLFVLILSFFPLLIYSQDQNKDNFVLLYNYGNILPHENELNKYSSKKLTSIELKYYIFTKNKAYWEKKYNYPFFGFGYNYDNLNKIHFLGNAHSLFSFVSFPVLNSKYFDFRYDLSLGLGYLTKKYDEKNNIENKYIGSYLNVYLDTGFTLDLKATQYLHFITGAKVRHYSNGRFKLPNKGINLFYMNWGLRVFFTGKSKEAKINTHTKKYAYKVDENIVSFGFGSSNDDIKDVNNYYKFSIIYNRNRIFADKYIIGMGVDYIYDPTAIRKINYKSGYKFLYKSLIGITAITGLKFGNTSLITNIGYYALKKGGTESPLYSRLGFNYTINKNIIAKIQLKAYFFRAEYIEFGIGYRWHN